MVHIKRFHHHMAGSNTSLALLAENVFREIDALWGESMFQLDMISTESNVTLDHMDTRFRNHRNWTGVAFFFAYLPLVVLILVSTVV